MMFVNMQSFLNRLFKKPSDREKFRDSRIAKIQEMGFEVRDRSGMHEGRYASRRYILVNAKGTVLDNLGDGYASSNEAYRAALQDLKDSA